ncbi:hypothetical protein C8A01DRAFT_20065 [Parachaetomium inaequale]|uniref:C2H2-type domain-containing protein n=1 Tax=Parachaetomium inaequale TaxID=2588326 RepID=A0AAN6SMN2_9PEZI|nr:hypothetical protein C8A01DRAFT_20065 [Parachaetomium inaequale]
MGATCRECKLEVASRAALVAHWQEQREQGDRHYHCVQCMHLFHTPEAEQKIQADFVKFHAAKQDLACPGCDERFVVASALIAHIEKNRCNTIKNDAYAARREEKLAFARELQRREYEDPDLPGNVSLASLTLTGSASTRKGPYDFTQYLSRAKDVGTVTPSLGRKIADLLTSDPVDEAETQPANAWARKKNLFPDAPAVVRPPSASQQAVQQPTEANEPEWSEHDPRNPGWDPEKYFVTYLNKYKCPHDRCPKSFPRAAGLRGHLLSAKHAGLIKVQCPRCCKWFDSMAAMTAHAESQSVRCDLRETNGYRQYLDQLTAGMLDTAGKHGDGTKKYTVPDAAREFFGTSQGRWAAEQRKLQFGWGSSDGGDGNDQKFD